MKFDKVKMKEKLDSMSFEEAKELVEYIGCYIQKSWGAGEKWLK